MVYITIDEYYTINEYNEALQALINNQVQHKEYIHIRQPYNWYLELKQKPIMINYDELVQSQEKYLVNKVEPANPQDDYILQRKQAFEGIKALDYYVLNKPLKLAKKSKYACFFKIKNRAQGIELSKSLGKIYYFGKFYKSIRVAMCYNSMIKNFISPDDILVEKTENVLQMETELNFKIFRLKDRLRKFTNTPYFDNGEYKPVKISQFRIDI